MDYFLSVYGSIEVIVMVAFVISAIAGFIMSMARMIEWDFMDEDKKPKFLKLWKQVGIAALGLLFVVVFVPSHKQIKQWAYNKTAYVKIDNYNRVIDKYNELQMDCAAKIEELETDKTPTKSAWDEE